MSNYDEFLKRLEAAIASPEARTAFATYLQGLTPQELDDVLAEAEQRDPEGALALTQLLAAGADEDEADLGSDAVS